MTGSLSSCGREYLSPQQKHQLMTRTAEITSGIIASCLPAFPAFFRHFLQKAATVFSKSSSDPHSNHSGSTTELKERSGHTFRGPTATEILQGTNWEVEEPSRQNSTRRNGGNSWATPGVKTKVSSSALRETEWISPIDIEAQPLTASQRGILKTVEVNVESESAHV